MWQSSAVRSALAVARHGWLAMLVLAVIAAAGHMPAAQHCHAGAATAVERVAAQSAGAEDSLPPETCCAHSVEVGQRTTCTASADALVPACGSAPTAATTGQARAGHGVARLLTQAQLQRWRH
jgi:hypothetical protein